QSDGHWGGRQWQSRDSHGRRQQLGVQYHLHGEVEVSIGADGLQLTAHSRQLTDNSLQSGVGAVREPPLLGSQISNLRLQFENHESPITNRKSLNGPMARYLISAYNHALTLRTQEPAE